jgi:hypothetical protein
MALDYYLFHDRAYRDRNAMAQNIALEMNNVESSVEWGEKTRGPTREFRGLDQTPVIA